MKFMGLVAGQNVALVHRKKVRWQPSVFGARAAAFDWNDLDREKENCLLL